MDKINLTPDPRILRMLGQIELKGWQCIAEFIDNSIDSMLKQKEDKQNEISVYIPKPNEITKGNVPLRITDNGLGMTVEQLQNCLKAGYTSRDVDNLGLFGMGFNIATARLGDVVEVWTSTKDSQFDYGVTIDLMEMQREKSFEREVLPRPKTLIPSGTTIVISHFHPRAENLLNRRQIINELHRTYSKALLEEYKISIKINDQQIKPHMFCLWNEERYVEYKGEKIPVYKPLGDMNLGSKLFCKRCFIWLNNRRSDISTPMQCPNCNSADMVIERENFIRGWLAIQRYNDMEDYGINIIRNGRIIKKRDKSLFYWNDRYNKNNGQGFLEYPIEQTYAGGRIVGEIFADFITPSYTKDSFEETESIWLDAVEFIRGKAPFQVEKAQKYGFNKNKSPLAQLFYGYRRSSPPGKRYLIPGTSNKKARYEDAKEWGRRFYAGDPEYQEDTKWWEAVLEAELGEENNNIDPTDPSNLNTSNINPSSPTPSEELGNLFPGKQTLIGTRTYSLDVEDTSLTYQLTVINYLPEIEFKEPIIFEPNGMNSFNVYINVNHRIFKDFIDGWEDLVIMEIAAKIHNKLDDPSKWPVNRIYYELKLKYLKDSMLNVEVLIQNAKSLMKEIQSFLLMGNLGATLHPCPNLNENELKLLKQNYLKLENKNLNNPGELMRNTTFLKFMDLKYLFKFLENYTHLVFDNLFFSLPLESLDDNDLKIRTKQQYISYFNDIKWFIYDLSEYSEELIQKQKNMIIRNKLSLELLNANRS